MDFPPLFIVNFVFLIVYFVFYFYIFHLYFYLIFLFYMYLFMCRLSKYANRGVPKKPPESPNSRWACQTTSAKKKVHILRSHFDIWWVRTVLAQCNDVNSIKLHTSNQIYYWDKDKLSAGPVNPSLHTELTNQAVDRFASPFSKSTFTDYVTHIISRVKLTCLTTV